MLCRTKGPYAELVGQTRRATMRRSHTSQIDDDDDDEEDEDDAKVRSVESNKLYQKSQSLSAPSNQPRESIISMISVTDAPTDVVLVRLVYSDSAMTHLSPQPTVDAYAIVFNKANDMCFGLIRLSMPCT